MRVAVDATPLLGDRTGIGQYTAYLIEALARCDDVLLTAVPFTMRGGCRPSDLDASVRWRHLPFPARLLQRIWTSYDVPRVEMFAGSVDIFHGTNFVLPPSGHAKGVLTVHDLSYLKYPELVNDASLKYVSLVPKGLSRAQAILTPSHAIAEEIIASYNVDPAAVTVTPLGVDARWFTAATHTPSQPAQLDLPSEYILAVGTLEPRKGLDVLLQAYRQLASSREDIPPLVLIGTQGWGPELDLSGLSESQLIRPGYVGGEDLRSVVAGASTFVFPSRYEGFGLPPLEAMAAGVPVVATAIPTSHELLGGFADLVPVGDPAALADSILRSIQTPPSRTHLMAASAHVAQFTWSKCAQATIQAYSRVVGG
ncbi:glycosyltransferase family 1 protein [Nakamurella antarctica]|uniref:Glycosyltransferase family 1 protein n=1 Tax=Nakamurella antarctica TaxID=1902245 RepID=A0A3G8ZXZ8_9ACTN|nr:glycosyltransferase family 1 protein [Nakamurella antarctica]AZI58521.1 glycosyltransferase family 1 protein [Nakamurella antarctica]